MSSVANVLQLKNEYTMDLINKTDYLFYQGIKSIYDSTSLINKEVKMLLREFQIELEKVSTWNDVMLEKEYERFVKSTNCDWLDELIVASFKSSAHIMLSTIGNDASFTNTKMNVEIPTGKRFIHNCYISICRRIWKKPQLMYDKLPKSELIRNQEEVTQMISESIRDTIRCNLPIKQVVSSYVQNNDADLEQPESNHNRVDEVLSSPLEVSDSVETGESNTSVLTSVLTVDSNVVEANLETNNARTTENTHQTTTDGNSSSTSNEVTNDSSSVLATSPKTTNGDDIINEVLASESMDPQTQQTTTPTTQISDNIEVPIVETDGGHGVGPQDDDGDDGDILPGPSVEKLVVNIDSITDSSKSISESVEKHNISSESATPRYVPLQLENDPSSNGIADKDDVGEPINSNHEITDSSLSIMEKEASSGPVSLEMNKNTNTREVFITSNSKYDDDDNDNDYSDHEKEKDNNDGYEEDDDNDEDGDDDNVENDDDDDDEDGDDEHEDDNVNEDAQHGGVKESTLSVISKPTESWSIESTDTERLPSHDKSMNINKSVKNVYIHEKKKKNEKKIKNVLGLDMEYDKFKTNQKGMLKHLLIKTNNQIGVM